MSRQHIAADATLADVVDTLARPEEYVRSALGRLHELRRTSGEVVLRIGRMGRGIIPHYRIDHPYRTKRLLDDGEDEQFEILAVFNGRNHKPLVPEGVETSTLRNEHWSIRVMDYDDVRELLRQLRGR